MKFTEEKSAVNIVSAYGDGAVTINGQRYSSSVIVAREQIVHPWPCKDVADLGSTEIDTILRLKPEIVLLGSGDRLHFGPTDVTVEFARAGLGYEVMDTGAACRTYNILAHEGRDVVAALIIDDAD